MKPLNPLAPEYNPIPPGVAPDPHAPLPSFLSPPPPPPPAAAHGQLPPPPCFLPNHVLAYTPHTAYYFTPAARNPLPPLPPPWIGSGRNRGLFPGDSSGSGRKFSRNFKSDRKPNNCNDKKKKRSVGFSRDLKSSMQKGGRKDDHHHHHHHVHVTVPLKRDEDKTTVMIKNIPYDCPRRELLSLIDRFCLMENTKASTSNQGPKETYKASYDFLYLPIDFGTSKGRGFAFVNFTNAATVWKFYEAFHGKSWKLIRPITNWPKTLQVVTAKIQGNEALVSHFAKSIFVCDTNEYLPVIFEPPRDGSGQPSQQSAIGLRRAKVGNSSLGGPK